MVMHMTQPNSERAQAVWSESADPPSGKNLRVGWILNGTPNAASSRLIGYNMHSYFTAQGISSKILFAPREQLIESLPLTIARIDKLLASNINVLVIVKILRGDTLEYLLAACKRKNIKIIYAFCDEPVPILLDNAEVLIAPSSHYRSILSKAHVAKLNISFDGFDHDRNLVKTHTGLHKANLCLVTSQSADSVPCIKRLPKNIRLNVIGPSPKLQRQYFSHSAVFKKTPYRLKYINWSLKTVARNILKCDIGVIPWDTIGRAQLIKSSNRLVMLMALGMPTIVSPLPSYREIIKQGENGFIAQTPEEWEKYIILLRDNPKLRAAIGKRAREDVLEKFTTHEQGKLFLRIFDDAVRSA